MSEHAKLSPSAAHRWARCAGSVAAEAAFPEEDSVYSLEGTAAHARAAARLEQAFGMALIEDATPPAADPAVDAYVNYVRMLTLTATGDTQIYVERRVTLLSDLVWGTADCVIRDGRRLIIVDYKHGQGVFVPAEGNEQLAIYAMAAIATFKWVDIETVEMHIVQPRYAGAEPARCWTLSLGELVEFVRPLMEQARRIGSGASDLVAGEHCRFCKARHTCPALQQQALTAAQAAFGPAGKITQPPAPAQLAPAQIAAVLEAATAIEIWLKAVRERAHDLAQNGVEIPGHKLVEKVGNRRWLSTVTAHDLRTEFGIDPHAPPELISPAEAARRIGGPKKKVDALLEPLTERPVTGLALVPASDKRPAALPSAAAAFRDNPLLPNSDAE